MKLDSTPITQHSFEGHHFFLKRDDLLHPTFSGNKARKFRSLLENDFPEIHTVVGCGSPQANSLYSLAALAKLKKWKCEFYVNHIASFIEQNPNGNYAAALSLGANIIDLSKRETALTPSEYITQHRLTDPSTLYVPEGGHSPIAEHGVATLANEILNWVKQKQMDSPVVALPSGTGTTALFLHKVLKKHNIKVITCACVGGEAYLTKQFNELGEDDHPTILSLNKKHHFGKLYREDYEVWQRLRQQTGVEFELLYDPMMWRCLLQWFHQSQESKCTLIYVHQGGLLGNETMLPRYMRKFPEITSID